MASVMVRKGQSLTPVMLRTFAWSTTLTVIKIAPPPGAKREVKDGVTRDDHGVHEVPVDLVEDALGTAHGEAWCMPSVGRTR